VEAGSYERNQTLSTQRTNSTTGATCRKVVESIDRMTRGLFMVASIGRRDIAGGFIGSAHRK
jgi:hypothetical protein